MTACQGRKAFITTLDAAAFLVLRKPVGEENFKLRIDKPPVPASANPFFGDVHGGQIEHFEQAVVVGKNDLAFGDFSELAVEPLNGIRGRPPHA
jgi:hypothetical protein